MWSISAFQFRGVLNISISEMSDTFYLQKQWVWDLYYINYSLTVRVYLYSLSKPGKTTHKIRNRILKILQLEKCVKVIALYILGETVKDVNILLTFFLQDLDLFIEALQFEKSKTGVVSNIGDMIIQY